MPSGKANCCKSIKSENWSISSQLSLISKPSPKSEPSTVLKSKLDFTFLGNVLGWASANVGLLALTSLPLSIIHTTGTSFRVQFLSTNLSELAWPVLARRRFLLRRSFVYLFL